jgi:RimJ/RimL family protein N-acetyltransferase
MHYLGGVENAEKIRDRHERYCRMSASGTGCMFVVLVGAEAHPAGSVGYWEKEWQGQAVWETGWIILPDFQGMGIAKRATRLTLEAARQDGRHRYVHAFPSVENGASNGICGSIGFVFQGEVEFEYPKGSLMRCNDWRFDLETLTASLETP